MRKQAFLIICLSTILSFQSQAATITSITFDELPEQVLNGISVKGVTFSSTSSNADYPVALFGTNSLDFADTLLMSAPWAAGATNGMLTIQFDAAIQSLSFDLGITTTVPTVPDAFAVQLFSGAAMIHEASVTTTVATGAPFAMNEAHFSYISTDPTITAATVLFTANVGNYIFDNLTYVSPVPVPGAAWLFVSGMLALLSFASRKSG